MATSKQTIPKSVKDLILKLKAEMKEHNFAFLNLELHDNNGQPQLSVDYKRVVVQDGMEIL